MREPILLHGCTTRDRWACAWSAYQHYLYEGAGERGRALARRYEFGGLDRDGREREWALEAWRDSAGIHIRVVHDAALEKPEAGSDSDD